MEIFAISGLINGIIAFGFGILVILKNKKSAVNILFFLLTLALTLWALSYWRWLLSDNADSALLWVRLLSIGSIFIPIFFLHWVLVVLKELNKLKRWIITSIYFIALVLVAFSFSDLFILGVEQKLFFDYWPNPGIAYTFYLLIIYIGLVLYALIRLFSRYNSTYGDARGQTLYIILGALFGFGGGLTNFFLWYDIPILPYGNFLVVLFPFLLGYSIVKHHLFNLKTIATEILVFFIVIILLVEISLADTRLELILKGGILIIISSFGYLLIKSVYREVEQREEIEILAKDLEKANVRLKELDKLKSEFVSIASHQLRSPLTAIKGYASLIIEGSFGKAPEAIKEAVQKIFDSSQTMVSSVEDFLNVSRIEQGRMKYEMSVFDIGELANKVIEELGPVAEKKKLKLSYSTETKDNQVKADIGKIKQVISNLVDNAIKYTEEGSIDIKVSKSNGEIQVAISDTGIGIKGETLPRLFDRFVRDKDANKVNVSGSGLGLYVAKQLVEGNKGRVWAESEGEGKGSTFIIELPAN